jgi:PAS domain-containing protein
VTRTLADQRTAGPDDAVVVAAAPSGDVVFSNRVARQVVGRRLQDLAAEFSLRHLDGRVYTASEWPLARSLGGEEVIDDRFVRVAPDGSRSLFRCSSWPAYDRDGRVVAAVAVTRNVSEERDREDRLTYLAGLLEHSDDAIVALDAGRHVTLWNNGAERMYGWTAAEVMGRHVT